MTIDIHVPSRTVATSKRDVSPYGVPYDELRQGTPESLATYLRQENVLCLVTAAIQLPVTRITMEV